MRIRDVAIKTEYLVAFFLVVMALLYTFPVGDGDFFWHVKTGQWIWQHHRLPDTDPFSFTFGELTPSRPEYRQARFFLGQYWLAQLVFYGIWRVAGEGGMVATRAIIYTGTLLFIYGWLRRSQRGLVPLALLFLVGNVLAAYPNERPQLFAYFFVPVLLVLLERVRSNPGHVPLSVAVALPLVMLVWSNSHGSFVLGVLLIAVYLAFQAAAVAVRQRPARGAVAILCCAILAGVANPNGLRAFAIFLGFMRPSAQAIAEFVSPITMAFGYHTFNYSYWALVLATLAVVGSRFRHVEAVHLVVIAGLLVLSLTGTRYIPFFALATPLLCSALPDRQPSVKTAVGALAVLILWAACSDYRNVLKFRAEKSFPVQACKFLASVPPQGRLFNDATWGGYVLCYTDYQVFTDGRRLVERVANLHDDVLNGVGWREILAGYNVETMLIPGTDLLSGRAYPLLLQLVDARDWALVYMDDVAVILVRNTEEHRALINAYAINKERLSEHIQARWKWQLDNNF